MQWAHFCQFSAMLSRQFLFLVWYKCESKINLVLCFQLCSRTQEFMIMNILIFLSIKCFIVLYCQPDTIRASHLFFLIKKLVVPTDAYLCMIMKILVFYEWWPYSRMKGLWENCAKWKNYFYQVRIHLKAEVGPRMLRGVWETWKPETQNISK